MEQFEGHQIPTVGDKITGMSATIVAEKTDTFANDGIRRSIVLCVRAGYPHDPYVTWSRWVSVQPKASGGGEELTDTCVNGHYIASFVDAVADFAARPIR